MRISVLHFSIFRAAPQRPFRLLIPCLLAATAFGQAQTAPQASGGIPRTQAAVQTAYALRYQEIRPGTGPEAAPGMLLTVQYTGWLAADGSKFDSSRDRASAQYPEGEPFQFLLGGRQVIPGWDTGLEGMRVGGIRRLLIPWQLAYGERGRPPVIPPKSDLIFDVELLQATTPDSGMPGYPESGQPTGQPTNTPPAPPTPPTPPTPPGGR